MTLRSLPVLIATLAATIALAGPTTNPLSRPDEANPRGADKQMLPNEAVKAALEKPATQPASQPSTRPASGFPTPAELVSKWKADKKKRDRTSKVALFELDGALAEKPADFSLFGGDSSSPTMGSL